MTISSYYTFLNNKIRISSINSREHTSNLNFLLQLITQAFNNFKYRINISLLLSYNLKKKNRFFFLLLMYSLQYVDL